MGQAVSAGKEIVDVSGQNLALEGGPEKSTIAVPP